VINGLRISKDLFSYMPQWLQAHLKSPHTRLNPQKHGKDES